MEVEKRQKSEEKDMAKVMLIKVAIVGSASARTSVFDRGDAPIRRPLALGSPNKTQRPHFTSPGEIFSTGNNSSLRAILSDGIWPPASEHKDLKH